MQYSCQEYSDRSSSFSRRCSLLMKKELADSIDLKRINRKKRIKKSIPVFIMLIPGILYFILFKYVPMWGILLAFKNYKPVYGFWDSKWVGIDNFVSFFTNPDFIMLLNNTFRIALNNIVFYFPVPILLALLMHELRNRAFKRTVQSIVYVPHFISWVVVSGMTITIFGYQGIVNYWLNSFGVESLKFLYSAEWFRPMLLIQVIWKESGWGTIIFVAALTGVNNDLYEAATIDGAGRLRKLWNVTLPSIRGTIIVMLILRVGRFLDTGFEQIFLLLNAMNRGVGEVFDTYVYEIGIMQGRYSYAITASIFKAIIGLTLIFISDKLAKRAGESGIL